MNTYLPVRKIIKVVTTHRTPKRERLSSLHECLEANENRRRRGRWRWALILFVCLTLVCLLSHRSQLPSMNGQIVVNKIYYDVPVTFTKKYETAVSHNTKKPEKTETVEDDDFVDTEMDIRTKGPGLPYCVRKKPYQDIYPKLKKGGVYKPLDCQPRMKIGIIVPYSNSLLIRVFRNRLHNLGIFLNNIHPFLMAQKLEYQIFVIEQYGIYCVKSTPNKCYKILIVLGTELFNKGRVYNAGFQEMMKFNTFNCVIFHDLDLLPMDENILYNCPTLPRHMCAVVNDTNMEKNYNISYKHKSLFGGVVAMTIEQFQRANGFSNLYFGWGGEDNDMYWRLRASGYPVVRYQAHVGIYHILPHLREPANPFRHHLLSRAVERYKVDGLSNSEYYVVNTNFYHLCTHIVVQINPRDDNITELNLKWGKTFYKF
ncbi:beta-1,4-N-acetylgalactosaminyltransferase bre-4-like [Helicoverpa zea]|uniref:beta-1,4-N-acetylgalactosaminyltransferase bre-4-like n=1 Tax=Helicoverpa zea TaxID=7113 RepID=UPI001F59B660|nr:beta-1,4-N-acetylgalactosaminyltransferase bre-4-like [Helicoverpa zea]